MALCATQVSGMELTVATMLAPDGWLLIPLKQKHNKIALELD
jgi:hypothetical protein